MSNQKLVNAVTSGLAWDLKHIRNQCGLTLEDVCLKLKWQQSKLSRMEGGQQCISEADLASVLVMYEVTGKERQHLLHLAERQDDPGRWENSPELSEESKTLMRLELETSSIVDVECLLVPGLVQTSDYTQAIMKAAELRPEQITARVKARKERQAILLKDKPPMLDMILEEAILRRVVGSHRIMAGQLRALLDATELPNLRLRVLLSQKAMNAGLNYPLYLMDFPRGNSVLHLEHKMSGVFLEDQGKIDICRRDVARLADAALSPAESLELVAKVAREHDLE
ncbi:MAG TPA: helix-turn-helix transcriptional regulator [Pseudonocardiaceae bacterium]